MESPLILTGPPGCGKSYWIQKYAQDTGRDLLTCPCRKDRTLREGRQKLHVLARRTQPAVLWLEGADDLTPEAQAFLRRILETHAKEVVFVLECRDAGRLQDPIRSRCVLRRMERPEWSTLRDTFASVAEETWSEIQCVVGEERSWRRVQQCLALLPHPVEWQHMVAHRREEDAAREHLSTDLFAYQRAAYDPERLIKPLLADRRIAKAYGECLEANGSRWAFLGYALNAFDPLPRTPAE